MLTPQGLQTHVLCCSHSTFLVILIRRVWSELTSLQIPEAMLNIYSNSDNTIRMTWPQWCAGKCLKLFLKNVWIYKCAYYKFYWSKESAAHNLQVKYTIFLLLIPHSLFILLECYCWFLFKLWLQWMNEHSSDIDIIDNFVYINKWDTSETTKMHVVTSATHHQCEQIFW